MSCVSPVNGLVSPLPCNLDSPYLVYTIIMECASQPVICHLTMTSISWSTDFVKVTKYAGPDLVGSWVNRFKGTLRFWVCNFQLFRCLKSIISLYMCMSKQINKFGCCIQNNKACIATCYQGFQSGPVPGTFTCLRSCIVPAEITGPPKISGG
jgi:hypothetical protein